MPPAKGILSIAASDLANDEASVRPVSVDSAKYARFDLTEYMDLDEFLLVTNQNDVGGLLDSPRLPSEEKKPSAELLATLLAGVKPSERTLGERTTPSMGFLRNERMMSVGSATSICTSSDDDDSCMMSDQPSESSVQPQEKRVIKRRKPRTYKYNPKPLQHKINRAFVPDSLKDEEYWERRRKNNEAAKKSREERRKKELEVLTKMEKLVQENNMLVEKLKKAEQRNEQLEKKLEELQKGASKSS